MAKKPDENSIAEADPERGDAILKRMLKSKPKPHKEMKKGKAKPNKANPEKLQ